MRLSKYHSAVRSGCNRIRQSKSVQDLSAELSPPTAIGRGVHQLSPSSGDPPAVRSANCLPLPEVRQLSAAPAVSPFPRSASCPRRQLPPSSGGPPAVRIASCLPLPEVRQLSASPAWSAGGRVCPQSLPTPSTLTAAPTATQGDHVFEAAASTREQTSTSQRRTLRGFEGGLRGAGRGEVRHASVVRAVVVSTSRVDKLVEEETDTLALWGGPPQDLKAAKDEHSYRLHRATVDFGKAAEQVAFFNRVHKMPAPTPLQLYGEYVSANLRSGTASWANAPATHALLHPTWPVAAKGGASPPAAPAPTAATAAARLATQPPRYDLRGTKTGAIGANGASGANGGEAKGSKRGGGIGAPSGFERRQSRVVGSLRCERGPRRLSSSSA
eukprot:1175436-Prorocentrum_minimum.AAC.2